MIQIAVKIGFISQFCSRSIYRFMCKHRPLFTESYKKKKYFVGHVFDVPMVYTTHRTIRFHSTFSNRKKKIKTLLHELSNFSVVRIMKMKINGTTNEPRIYTFQFELCLHV